MALVGRDAVEILAKCVRRITGLDEGVHAHTVGKQLVLLLFIHAFVGAVFPGNIQKQLELVFDVVLRGERGDAEHGL